jgi:hypothetical protein
MTAFGDPQYLVLLTFAAASSASRFFRKMSSMLRGVFFGATFLLTFFVKLGPKSASSEGGGGISRSEGGGGGIGSEGGGGMVPSDGGGGGTPFLLCPFMMSLMFW